MIDEFTCKLCNFTKEYEEFKSPMKCPECGHGFYRLTCLKKSRETENFVSIGYQDSPRWSWSMGVNPQDIPAMMQRYPNRQYHPKTGQLLVKNRPHKRKLMKEHRMHELS
jgi:hypothetical protein